VLAARLLAALPPELPAAIVRDGTATVLACGAEEVLDVGPDDARDPFAALDDLGPGFWVGFVAFEAGSRVERVVARRLPHAARPSVPPCVPPSVPPCVPPSALHARFVRFAARVEIRADRAGALCGRGPSGRALDRALAAAAPPPEAGPGVAGWRSSLDRGSFEAGVRAIVELIRAGECYQVNLTRMLATPDVADPVELWTAVAAGNPAPHATFLRTPDLAVVSASPERFLRIDGATVETRPIKGTAATAAALRASDKDRAENVMIVDLARNDLGRVCVPGSVTVPALCAVEQHPGLVHLVSTVTGRLRSGTGRGTVLRATFPPASVTGAPKPRVLQTIEDLEPAPRGVYCGALGWFDTERDRTDVAVAIRTFTLTPHGTMFGVGAGITADSDPAAEWAETELKARRLLRLAAGRGATTAAIVGA